MATLDGKFFAREGLLEMVETTVFGAYDILGAQECCLVGPGGCHALGEWREGPIDPAAFATTVVGVGELEEFDGLNFLEELPQRVLTAILMERGAMFHDGDAMGEGGGRGVIMSHMDQEVGEVVEFGEHAGAGCLVEGIGEDARIVAFHEGDTAHAGGDDVVKALKLAHPFVREAERAIPVARQQELLTATEVGVGTAPSESHSGQKFLCFFSQFGRQLCLTTGNKQPNIRILKFHDNNLLYY